jgi:hypothetical protein
MSEGFIDYQVVIFTSRHVISGDLALKDKRLSDHINERIETIINLSKVTVARLENPSRVVQMLEMAVVPKPAIVMIFEPPQKAVPPSNRFFSYIKKEKCEIFLIMDGMEVCGIFHTQSKLDFQRLLVNSPDAFLPITQATVRLETNPDLTIRQEAILINTQRVRFIGKSEINPSTIARSTMESAAT